MKVKSYSLMLYTIEEVSLILKTNKDYVYDLIKARVLPAIKLGRIKILKESLEQFLKNFEGKDLTDPFNVKDIKFN